MNVKLRSLGLVVVFLALPGLVHAAGLFGQMEFKASRIDSIPKWVDVLSRTRSEWPILQACWQDESRCLTKPQQNWRKMMVEQQGQGVSRQQMKAVNSFFNRYKYITDDRLLGMSDYWQTPNAFIEHSGDCEDYSIAKYFTLKALGWSPSGMRLVIVHDSVRNIAHAVLAVTFGGQEYILDNLATEPLPQNLVLQYAPYYAVNETSRWVFIQPNP